MVKENIVTLSMSKGFKQTEIGLIPEDWELRFIKKVAPLQRGFDLPITRIQEGPFPVVFSNGINRFHNRFMVKGPGIVTGRSGTIGKVFYIDENFWPHNTSLFVTEFNDVNPKFIYFLYKYLDFNKFSSGSGVPTLNRNDVHDTKIPLPPLPEQQAIAEALSDADAWIESLEKLIVKKRLIKQGAMQQLLTPKDGWEVKKLGEVINVYRGGSPRPIQDYLTDKSDGLNWIKIGDTSASGKFIVSANEKIIAEGEKNSRRVFPGDFLLSNSMSFGRPYILKIEGCIHDGWLVLQNYQASFETEFLYYLLTSKYILDQYKSKAAGSSVLNLNKELVSSVELIIPSLTVQTRIATILSDMDAELEALENQLAKARQIKQGMMQELLTGRVRLV
ncbi:restriction endonuclease subunit S [Solitalea longa]|nr:restriction endonuclease subunit S [Solitalea longa]